MMSEKSTTPPTSPQQPQSLKRQQPHLTHESLDAEQKQMGFDRKQNPSPTKKRKVHPRVHFQYDSVMDPKLEAVTGIFSSNGLEEFPALQIQDTKSEGMQVVQAAMVPTKKEFAPSLSLQPTVEQIEDAKSAVIVEMQSGYIPFKPDEKVDVGRVGISSRPWCPMMKDGTLLPYTGPERYKPLTKAHDMRSLTLLQFTDCPNLIGLVEQRSVNYGNGTITDTARALFDHLWSMAWGFDMETLAEMDAKDDSDFRKLMHLIMVEYQAAETKRILTFNALGYRN